MIILVLVNYQGDFGRSRRTSLLKGTRVNVVWIISQKTTNHIGACFGVYVVEFREPADTSRLVKGGETFRILLTLGNLFFINDVESITETIVCQADLFRVPTIRLILGL
jgi:hypothetical protein